MKRHVPVRWLATDGVRLLEGVYEASDNGSLRMKEWRGEVGRLDGVSVDPKKPCDGCGKPEIVEWLGVRWYGTPKPMRWWRLWMYTATKDDMVGCGCIVKLKAAYLAVRAGIIAVRRA